MGAAQAPLLGATIAGYTLLSVLGRGATSVVYLAQREDDPRALVALKVLTVAYAAEADEREAVRLRFLREARAASKLQHAHILPVLECDEADGLPYMALPFVVGGTLAARIAGPSHPLPLVTVADYVAQVAGALDYAHEHGVVHRDVKPSNVLIEGQQHVYLSDFGIARLVDSGTQALTQDGLSLQTGQAILGTPYYMAPEQIRGEAVGPAADIYALGAMLYQLVTGRVPFRGDDAVAIIAQHLHTVPQPPRRLRGELPEAAEAAILRALAKAPAERFASAGELAQAFAEGLAPPAAPAEMRDPDTARMVPPSLHPASLTPSAAMAADTRPAVATETDKQSAHQPALREDDLLSVAPAAVRGYRRASYAVALHNVAPEPAHYTLDGDGPRLAYAFAQRTIPLDPAGSSTVALTVRAPVRWLGRPAPTPVRIRATSEATGASHTAAAQFTRLALFSPLRLFGICLLAIVVTLVMILPRPSPSPGPTGSAGGRGPASPSRSTATATASAAATATPGGAHEAILYQADWSHGMAGWTGAPEWKAANGQLVSDGSGTGSDAAASGTDALTAPYRPGTVADYAVEARLRVVDHVTSCYAAIRARAQPVGSGYGGYFAGVDTYLLPFGDAVIAKFAPGLITGPVPLSFNPINQADYTPDLNWHTYRLEVRGSAFTLLIDGQPVVQATDTDQRFSTGGQVGLDSGGCSIEVSSFAVSAV